MLPKFHGNIETNLGSGAIFDVIRDHDGKISNNLRHYLKDPDFRATHQQHLLFALDELKSYLLKHNIITMAIKAKNVLYQFKSDGSGILYIIDNIGNTDFIPALLRFDE